MPKQEYQDRSLKEANPTGAIGIERRNQLVLTAYQLIFEKGFEGLRTREVADRVGINHATLHYYFPTKEDLIRGVVELLIQKFSSPHTLQYISEYSPIELVRAEFVNINQISETPHMIVVLSELSLRALREPTIAELLNRMDQGWQKYLIDILEIGVKQGSFRRDLDVELSSLIIISMIKGIRSEALVKSQSEISRISTQLFAQLEGWLINRG